MKLLYKGKIAAAAALVLFMSSFAGCEGDELANNLGEKLGDSVNEAMTDVKNQVSEDIKSTLVNEVKAYINSDELSENLGISPEDQETIFNSLRDYVDNYEFDADQIKEVTESVEEFLQNAKGLSTDEIKENIAEILETDKE